MKDLCERGYLAPISYDADVLLTGDMYELVYKKLWATIRYDILRELEGLTAD